LVGERSGNGDHHLIKKLRPVQQGWLDTLDELVALEDKLNSEVASEANSAFKSATSLMMILGLMALAGGIAAAFYISRSLIRQLVASLIMRRRLPVRLLRAN
jgi:methyl-accepting chemotaxis protein